MTRPLLRLSPPSVLHRRIAGRIERAAVHYYPFHIGDYLSATAHLSPLEDLAYRRLLDLYYDLEGPIPLETQWVTRRLRLGYESVSPVLEEFFQKRETGWHNLRCDEEIANYKRLCEKNRTNGKLGGRPKKTQSVILANPNETQTKPNQEPLTNNQEPIKERSTTLSGSARPMSWDFVAGLIDGEGSVRLNRSNGEGNSIAARITIYNTNREVLERVVEAFKIGSISTRERSGESHKDLHELNFRASEIPLVVENCQARVIVKAKQFQMLEDFLAHYPHDMDFCNRLYEDTKNLNARGKPDVLTLNGYRKESIEVLDFLNVKTGRKYRAVDANLRLIAARLKDGASVAECRQVIAKKSREWAADGKMAEYLRPATLFNATKFAQYQGELGSDEPSPNFI